MCQVSRSELFEFKAVLQNAHLLALEDRLFDLGLDPLDPTHEVKVGHIEVFGPVEEVGHVKVVDVVASDDVGVGDPDELRPLENNRVDHNPVFPTHESVVSGVTCSRS